jgi:hypothetical protein
MDDSFAFVAPFMPRRRVDPFALKAAVVFAAFVASIGAFGAYVVGRERALDERIEAARSQASSEVTAVTPSQGGLLDAEARASLNRAASLAEEAFARTSSFSGAGIADLGAAEPNLLFVDGPSHAPTIVSVEAGDSAWAAAVMTDSGCWWIVLSTSSATRRGTSQACTGAEVLVAHSAVT